MRDAAYSLVKPTPPPETDQAPLWAQALSDGAVRDPPPELRHEMAIWSPSAASLLGIDKISPEFEFEKNVLGGFGRLCKGMEPYAACYGGHQFGSWARQLGDGRAITLGEANGWEVQLKGAGLTPYSRTADGRAVLRSSLREFLCSEAMAALNVPTTRALALVTTGTGIVRDMFYSGQPRLEPGAVCTRIAPSFLRFGSFQLPASRQEFELVGQLADFAIEHHFPTIEKNDYESFVKEVSRLNAVMVAHWMSVGFVHGVMNTDNMSILGLTIDYGPYGFLDDYDPEYTPNTTDEMGKRYKYGAQPDIARWNVLQFVQSMVAITDVKTMQEVVDDFPKIYEREKNILFAKKLGFAGLNPEDEVPMLKELFSLMKADRMDWTNTWRSLSKITSDMDAEHVVERVFTHGNIFSGRKKPNLENWILWLTAYIARIRLNESKGVLSAEDRVKMMTSVNPAYILRNYMAQVAIEKAEKCDFTELKRLYKLLRNPYEEQIGMEKYTLQPPDWAAKRGVKVNSCSS